jgi:hypothetical protein
VADFFEAVSEELPTWGGTHVKTIGDALRLRIPDPAKAVLLGLQITHELLRGHGAPAVRVGLHHGPAIERDGDYFGAAVNLAVRVGSDGAWVPRSQRSRCLTPRVGAPAPRQDEFGHGSAGAESLQSAQTRKPARNAGCPR